MVLVFMAVGLVGLGVLRLGARLIHDGKPPEGPTLLVSLGALTIQVIASVIAVYGVGRWRRGYTWADLGLRPMRLEWWIGSVLGGLICLPLLGLLAMLTSFLMGESEPTNPQLPFLAPNGRFSWTGAVGMFLLAGVLVPWVEELFFRGVLYRWARRGMGVFASAALIAVLFGLVHGHPVVGVAVMPLGFLAALVYEYSGSLWSSVVVHAVNNGVKILLLYAILAAGLNPEDLKKMAERPPVPAVVSAPIAPR
jgi:hypothetical protein